jgi:hypothetical protein
VRIYTYVIATDAGSAPNYDPPFVTLTVCKPRIRKQATVGDCVLAFAGASVNPSDPHAVVWAGVVTEVILLADYWDDPRFANKKPGRTPRPDNLYRQSRGRLVQVPNPIHGPESTPTDISGKNSLIFDPAWRFGAYGPRLPTDFELRMVGGRRGHRVTTLSADEWRRLRAWLNAQSPVSIQNRSPTSIGYAPHKAAGKGRC